jgi:rare lipoprotein A
MLKNVSLSIAALLLGYSYITPWSQAQALSEAPRLVAAKPAASSHATPKNFNGNVSWYGVPFHGKKTASGQIFDMNKCSSAHLHLPFFTRVMVEDPKNGKSVVVKVLDRGPYAKGRVMDLSREAAKRLGTLGSGVAYVECTVLADDDDGAPAADAKAEPAKASSPPTGDKK